MTPYVTEYLEYIKDNSGKITITDLQSRFPQDTDIKFSISKMIEAGYLVLNNGYLEYRGETYCFGSNAKKLILL